MTYSIIGVISIISVILIIISFLLPPNLCDTFLILGGIGFGLAGVGFIFLKSQVIACVTLVLMGLFITIAALSSSYGNWAFWLLIGLIITVAGLIGYWNCTSNLSVEHKIVSVLSKLEPIGYVFISIGFVFTLMYMLMKITGVEMMFAYRLGSISLFVGIAIVFLDEISDNYKDQNLISNETSDNPAKG